MFLCNFNFNYQFLLGKNMQAESVILSQPFSPPIVFCFHIKFDTPKPFLHHPLHAGHRPRREGVQSALDPWGAPSSAPWAAALVRLQPRRLVTGACSCLMPLGLMSVRERSQRAGADIKQLVSLGSSSRPAPTGSRDTGFFQLRRHFLLVKIMKSFACGTFVLGVGLHSSALLLSSVLHH